ncbi:unnamed protein product, partial [marine sediment metagenome]
AIPGEGEVCSAVDVGCREYKGPAANNVRQVLFDDFETGIGSWTGGNIVTESVNFPGHSMEVTPSNTVERPVANFIQQGKSYLLSFWVKGSGDYKYYFSNGTPDLYFIDQNDENSPHTVNVSTDEWQEINIGQVLFNRSVSADEKLVILAPTAGTYIDNVILKEVQDNIYLIKDSWSTPESCILDMVGCQLYTDQNNNPYYFKSFSHLCEEQYVGCEALIDTQNYSSPFAKEFNSGDVSEINILSDEMIYLVNDEEKNCQAADKGCEKMGLPQLGIDIDGNVNVLSWSDVYLKNNPDFYTLKPILCVEDDLGCETYDNGIYFKDPELQEKVCEYRGNVLIGGKSKTGWFQQGTDLPCYESDLDTFTYGILSVLDDDYEGWAGICPNNQTGCTQFIDPSISTSYYYLDNEKLDKASCNGQVSLKQGCILFSDPNDTDGDGSVISRYNSAATYRKSAEATPLDSFVNPVDCTDTGTQDWTDYC